MAKTKFLDVDIEKATRKQVLDFIVEVDSHIKEKDNYTLTDVYENILLKVVDKLRKEFVELDEELKKYKTKSEKLEKSLMVMVDKLTKKDFKDILKNFLED